MSIVVSTIVSALAAGALASAKDVAGRAVVDAYEGLKKILAVTYGVGSINLLEKKPDSQGFKVAAEEEIADSKAAEDNDVVEMVRKLIEAIEADENAQEALNDGGIVIGDIVAGKNALLEGVKASRGIKIGDVSAEEGDAILRNLEAGNQGK